MSYCERMNPAELPCYNTCMACLRCQDKGRYARCSSCSGRGDRELKYDSYDRDNVCDCRNGILRWRTQQGKLIIAPYPSNPFKGKVVQQRESQDERDWNSYLGDQREKRNDPHYDPIVVS